MAKGGSRPGAGRKSIATLMGLAETMDNTVPQTRRIELFRRLLDMSRAEDEKVALKAIELLLAYLYGKPTQVVDLNARVETEYEVIWSDGAGVAPATSSLPDGSDEVSGTVQGSSVRAEMGQDSTGSSDVPGDGA